MARLFKVSLGADFPRELVAGLRQRFSDTPEQMARVQLYLNSGRMLRRVSAVFQETPGFLPQMRLVTDLNAFSVLAPDPVSALRRKLELAQLVKHLIDTDPTVAPHSAVFDLADSLAALMKEMQDEGVSPEALQNLDVAQYAEHWQKSLRFLNLITPFFGPTSTSSAAQQRAIVARLSEEWRTNPPEHPIVIAGSTGSRGTTRLLMEAVAKLPKGYVVLPGFDAEQPNAVWDALKDPLTSEDHPQYRYAALMQNLGLRKQDLENWTTDAHSARGALVSLALRPAPVTDQWMTEGPQLTGIDDATKDITLIEAPDARTEAVAIALRLRQAADTGETAALISPDRVLTRQVTAALDRWDIEPDDSAGRPLPLSPPGRFLRHVAALFGAPLTAEALITLLKHPLTHTGGDDRGPHLIWTRELELHIRKYGPPFPTGADLQNWAAARDDAPTEWAKWLAETFDGLDAFVSADVDSFTKTLLETAETLANGPNPTQPSELWQKNAGEKAQALMSELTNAADAGGMINAHEFETLLYSVLQTDEVRDPRRPHPNIMIWGTLEARVLGADLVILGGLNEGSWPEPAAPDPWMSRDMRKSAGLLLPERQIGLSAHDFQQAVMAPKVWLTRSLRDAEAQTVTSRWLNRIVNLLDGASDKSRTALKDMRSRGAKWVALAKELEKPAEAIDCAARPSPRPPVEQRPRKLSVTRIRTLIRDPYAIYAQYVLRLRPLDPIRPDPDARLKGTILHDALEQFLRQGGNTREDLMRIVTQVVTERAPWPAAQRVWLAKFENVADWFLETEADRRAIATPLEPEQSGAIALDCVDFTLTAKADRFDQTPDGRIIAYDYKTGTPPTDKQQKLFDNQLLLEAAMVERGAFEKIGAAPVAGAQFIGLGSTPKIVDAPIQDVGLDTIWEQLSTLILAYQNPDQGYTARRALEQDRFGSDYDQLSRFREWDATDEPKPKDMP